MKTRPALSSCSVLAALVLLFSAAAAARAEQAPSAESINLSSDERSWLAGHPVITLATYREGAPYGFVDEQGEYIGVIPDITARIEKLLGIRIQFAPLEYGALLDRVREGDADMTTLNDPSDMPYSKHYLKTGEFLFLPYALFVRKDSRLAANPSRAIHGATIALVRGWDLSNPALEALRGNKFVFADSMLDCITLVLHGQADAFYDVHSEINYLLWKNAIQDLQVFKVYNEGYPVSFYIRRDWPELKNALQKALAAVPREERTQLLTKWNAFLGDVSCRLRMVDLGPEERQWLKEHPVIRVGIHAQWAPVEFIDEDGQGRGISVEYLKQLEKMIGIRFEIIAGTAWQELLDNARSRRIDMLSSIAEMPGHSDYLAFTRPYLSLPIIVLAAKDAAYISDLHELDGRRVAVVKGHAVQEWLARDFPAIELVPAATTGEMLGLLAQDQVQACVERLPVASYYLRKSGFGTIKIAGQTPYTYQMGMAVRSDYRLLAGMLQKALDIIPADERKAAYQKWMTVAYERVFDYSLLWKVALPLLLALAVFAYWTRRLFREVSSRKRAETLLREAQKNLEHMNLELEARVLQRTTQLEQATHTLRESEERFRAIAENTPDAIFITDVKGQIRYCNRAAEKMFGYGRGELLGQPTSILLTERLRGSEDANRENYLASADAAALGATCQTTAVRKDVTEFPVEFPFFSWEIDGEKFFTAIMRDITERKLMEEALHSERERLAGIIAASPVTICGITASGTTSFINRSGEEITGYTNRELAGLNWWDIFYPGELHRQVDDLFSRLAGADVVNYEMVLKTKSEGLRTILWNSISNRDSQGALQEVIGFGSDITERKRAENEVRQARDYLENLFRASPDAILVIDPYGYIIMANESVASVYGYMPQELIGQHAAILTPEQESAQQANMDLLTQLFDKGIIRNCTAVRQRKDGRIIQVETSVVLLKNPDGTTSGAISSSRDVTDRKKLEEQLRQSQKMEAIGTLAGGIAHDFNNILGIIFGYAELSQELAAGNGPLEGNLAQILKAAERARDLVRQILAFSRKRDTEVKPLYIHLVIKECLKLLRASLPSTIDVSMDIDEAEDIVAADPTEIHQIIMNLCTNAASAMQQAGGSLEIQLRALDIDEHSVLAYSGIEPGPYVQLSVRDTGAGIPADIIDRIFEPFFTTKEMGRGTGMGLAVVHGIVKSLRGDVKVYSEQGRGSVFHVVLPRVQGVLPASAPGALPAPRGHEAVLLVDDESVLLQVGTQMLESLGYQVTALQSPLEALKLFGQNPAAFDIVITDQTMSGLTGYELAQQLMRIRPDIPIILCTGYSDLVTAESALAGGIRAFVIKPLNRLTVAETIRRVLDGSRI